MWGPFFHPKLKLLALPRTLALAGFGMLSQAPVTFFLHISSSGGTSICRLAQEQPCARVPSCGANCNLNCRHPWDWRHHCLAPACAPPAKACRPSHKPGCAGLRRYAANRNLTFLSSETMLLEGPCPDFAYVTVPRLLQAPSWWPQLTALASCG